MPPQRTFNKENDRIQRKFSNFAWIKNIPKVTNIEWERFLQI